MTDAIRFIVAYQTMSDYLDNLCDRSTSRGPLDLHGSMRHALLLDEPTTNCYRHRREHNDGGYLLGLVETCRSILSSLPALIAISLALVELETCHS
jgi:tetraprenyl-beta-curcumene synthase